MSQNELWNRLETYRQRYHIDDHLGPILSLEQALQRRRRRSVALSRRLEELEKQIEEVRAELHAIDGEIRGSKMAGALLIEKILDQIRVEMGETWSPTPVRGFRVWRIQDNQIIGNQVGWPTPTLISECLREIPGEDLPHPVAICGPPACGIYAVKDLSMFGDEVAEGMVDRSVVGVVAMTGKVIEHEDGYRSQSATAVAVVAKYGSTHLATEDPGEIEDLFDDPFETLARVGARQSRSNIETREFLESALAKEEQWI